MIKGTINEFLSSYRVDALFHLRHVVRENYRKLLVASGWMLSKHLWWVLSVFLLFLHAPGEYWRSQWCSLFVICGIALSTLCWKKYGLAPALCIAWTIISAIYAIEFANYPSAFHSMKRVTTVEAIVGYGLSSFLIVTAVIVMLSDEAISTLERALPIVCLAASVHIIGLFILGHRNHQLSGFCDQAGMAGCFIATTFPFCIEWLQKSDKWRGIRGRNLIAYIPMMALFIIITLAWASVPLLCISAVCAVYLVLSRWRKYAIYGFLALACVIITASFSNAFLLSSSGRFSMYRIAFSWWIDNINPLIGAGNSMFFILGPMIQEKTNFMVDHWWGWLHSDLAQVVWEQGIIGGLFIFILIVECLRHAIIKQRPALVAAISSYVVMALFDYPARLAHHAFLGALLIALSLETYKKRKEINA